MQLLTLSDYLHIKNIDYCQIIIFTRIANACHLTFRYIFHLLYLSGKRIPHKSLFLKKKKKNILIMLYLSFQTHQTVSA